MSDSDNLTTKLKTSPGLYLIAGVKGVGKTAFVSWLIDLCRDIDDKQALYFYSKNNYNGLLSDSANVKTIEISELPLQTGHMYLEAQWAKSDHGLSAVVIDDYRGLLRTEEFRGIELSRNEKILYLLTRLKTLSEVFDVPVIITGNVDDDYIYGRTDKHPLVTDIPDHEYVRSFADGIVLMHREEMFVRDSEMRGITEFKLIDPDDMSINDYRMCFVPETKSYTALSVTIHGIID